MEWLTEPFQLQFMRWALIASLLAGLNCSLVGTYVVLRKMSFLGGALAHTVLPGVVIAAMIGAKGLGGEVWKAIQRLQMGYGFEAGIGIVIVAILLDRVLQRVGVRNK